MHNRIALSGSPFGAMAQGITSVDRATDLPVEWPEKDKPLKDQGFW
jgi:hypothetical protein